MRKNKLVLLGLVLLLLCALPFSLYAGETQVPELSELSLDQAISRALKYNKDLKLVELDADYADETRDAAENAWRPQWTTNYVPGVEDIYAALLSADLGYEAAQKSLEMKEEYVTAQTNKRYYDILKYQENVEVLKTAVAAAEKDFYVSKAFFEVGMLSKIGYDQASVQLTQKRNELAAAENSLNSAYLTFNQLVDLELAARPVLTSRPEFKEFTVEDLDSEIYGIVRESPAQWIAEQDADLQERLLGFSSNYDQAEIKSEQAEIEADSLKEETTKVLYNIYYNIKNAEDSYRLSQDNAMLLEESLRIAQLKYKLGMVTSAEVADAEAALAEGKQGLSEIIRQHELMVLAFNKPWIASALGL